VESAEVKRSRRAAILQLKMGRLAHVIGITSGLALALTAVIAYGLGEPWDFLANPPEVIDNLKWTIPLVAGLIVGLVAVALKWEPYVADRREPHFIVSLLAVIAPSILIAILLLRGSNILLFGSTEWLFPASLLGFSLTEISLAMTWEGSSTRKTISIAAAVFPIVLLSFPLVYNPADIILGILPMAYLGSAVAIQLSGSMLHIIASSTATQQREVLKASDSKLKEQTAELDKKRQAIAYREDALRSRESDLETDLKKFSDELAALEERKQQVTALETEAEQRLQGVRESRENFAKHEASLEKDRETLQLRHADIDTQRRELENLSKSISAREAAIAARDRDTSRLQLDLQAKEREIKSKLAEIDSETKALAHTSKQLDDVQAALVEREKQLGIRESTLDLKGLQVVAEKEQLGMVSAEKTAVKSLEQQLLMKQEALKEKEVAINAMDEDIRKKSEKAERLSARADQQLNELVDRENKLLAKEKELSDKESGLRADLGGLTAKLEDMERARVSVTDKERQYQDLTETTRTKLSSLSTREEELGRKMIALEKRETKIKELEQMLKSEREKSNATLRQLLEKEKDLKAEETELSLRHAELKSLEREILERVDELEAAELEEPVEDEREKTLQLREERLMEKEQEVKSRLYQREKELEKKEHSLKAQISKDLEEMEEAVEEEYAVEKVKSGMERLDDLLMGGMPFGSNIMFVGPPFIGKEVAMFLFLAEGLKKGIPAIIITTSRSLTELSKDMAPILPTFMEFDQLGLVRWIDASSIEGDQIAEDGPHKWVTKVAGPGDFDGITKALENCLKDFQKQKQPYFRVAYMSLSMSMTQSNEKAGLQFLQGFSGRVKQGKGVSAYAVERGMHTEQQLEAMQHHMTGALQFKTDKQKTLISVQGVGDVQTRDWIEYKHTNKALMIGAFSLERIR